MSKQRANLSAKRKETPLSQINRDHMIKEIFDLYTQSVRKLRGKSLTKAEADYLYVGLYNAVEAIEIAEKY
jgi:hypothetical protein